MSRSGYVMALCVLLGAALLALGPSASAQGSMSAQARLQAEGTGISARRDAVSLDLALSQPVPYRVQLLADPPRLVVDLNTVAWGAVDLEELATAQGLRGVRHGHLPDGWARLVLDLGGPFALESSEQRISAESGAAQIALRLRRVTLEEFEASAADEARLVAQSAAALLHPQAPAVPVPAPEIRKPLVMLDPGHGGIDPGAEVEGIRESDLVLAFAQKLRETLLRRGVFDVAMTREADVFVSLDGRIRAARAAGADLFVSIHADTVPEGLASGAVMYLLGDEASDDSAAYLAERHDRADMLAGVDLHGTPDEIARVLMSVAWQDTKPRSRALAEALVEGIETVGLRLHRRPIQSGAFTVLRAVDMPSVLVELGFMSSPRDLANLQDPDWNRQMVEALADALEQWQQDDTALQRLRRR